jgi:hypothetical protein
MRSRQRSYGLVLLLGSLPDQSAVLRVQKSAALVPGQSWASWLRQGQDHRTVLHAGAPRVFGSAPCGGDLEPSNLL